VRDDKPKRGVPGAQKCPECRRGWVYTGGYCFECGAYMRTSKQNDEALRDTYERMTSTEWAGRRLAEGFMQGEGGDNDANTEN
jgi:hypothetical protein